jgi:hypothetical protein
MAISHSLYLQTSLSLKAIEDLLFNSNLGMTILEDNGGLDGLGIWITYSIPDEYSKRVTLKEDGFIPDVSIGFRMAFDESETEGEKTTEKACAILLNQENGDAVFFYNSDNLAFKRVNGKLTVYEGWTQWLMPELDKFGIKYEIEKSEYAELCA